MAELGDFVFGGEVAITRQILPAIEGKQGVARLELEVFRVRQAQPVHTFGEKVEPPDRKGEEAAGSDPPGEVLEPAFPGRPSRQVMEHSKKRHQVEGLERQLRRQLFESQLEKGAGGGGQSLPGRVEQGRAAVDAHEVPRQKPVALEETGETPVAAADVEAGPQRGSGFQLGQEAVPALPGPAAGRRKTAGPFLVEAPIEIQKLVPGRFVHEL